MLAMNVTENSLLMLSMIFEKNTGTEFQVAKETQLHILRRLVGGCSHKEAKK